MAKRSKASCATRTTSADPSAVCEKCKDASKKRDVRIRRAAERLDELAGCFKYLPVDAEQKVRRALRAILREVE